MEDIIVRLVDMPHALAGCTAVDADGDYNVYLNARRGDNLAAWVHEMRHIMRGDFNSDKPIDVVEE